MALRKGCSFGPVVAVIFQREFREPARNRTRPIAPKPLPKNAKGGARTRKGIGTAKGSVTGFVRAEAFLSDDRAGSVVAVDAHAHTRLDRLGGKRRTGHGG
jgi:hypothetical protein